MTIVATGGTATDAIATDAIATTGLVTVTSEAGRSTAIGIRRSSPR